MPIAQLSILFSFLAMICWGTGDFFAQRTIRQLGDFKTLLWINFLGGLALTPFIIKDWPLIILWPNLLTLIFLALIQLVYGLFLFRAYSQGKLSVIEVVMIGELPLTIILGFIFFGERLSFLQVLVVLIILVGIFLVSKSRPAWQDRVRDLFTGRRFIWEKGVFFAIFAVLFSAAYNFFTAYTSREISAFTAVWFPWLSSSLIIMFYLLIKEGLGSFFQKSWRHKKLIISASLLDTFGWLFYALAISQEELSIITTIVSGYAVVSMILGLRFNHEKISYWQYLGAASILIGAAIMSFIS